VHPMSPAVRPVSIFRRPEPVRPRFEISVYEPSDVAVKAAEFSTPLLQSLTYGGFYASTYGAMYRRQPAVRSVVDFLARNIAQLNGKVYERVSDTDRLEVNGHPLAALLRNPNQLTSRYGHMFATVADVAIYDRAYWQVVRRGRQLGVFRISPAKLLVETDEKGNRTYRLDGVEIPRSEIVVFPGYSPDTDAEGVSPLETLRRVLLEEQQSALHRSSMMENAARASGIITRPKDAPAWSPEARQRFRASLDAHLAGSTNSGKVALLEEGMTWETVTFDAHHEEYIASRRLTYEEVAIVYFGPIGGRAWLETATAAGSEENHRQMYQDVLGPFLRYLQDEIELQLLPHVQPFGRETTYFEFNLADKLKGSFEEQARIITTATGVPTVAVNEGRARMNLPRLDDPVFDLPVMPMNVTYGGQPAVTIPTADPSTPAPPPLMAAAALEAALIVFFKRQAEALVSPQARARNRTRWDAELATLLTAAGVPTAAARATQINAETFAMLDGVGEVPPAITAVFEMTKNVRAAQIAAAHIA